MDNHISKITHENYKLKLKYAELLDRYEKLQEIQNKKCICENYHKILKLLQLKIKELTNKIIEKNKNRLYPIIQPVVEVDVEVQVEVR